MTDTSVISTSGGSAVVGIGGAGIATLFGTELISVLFSLRWVILFIVALVITDFWSGLTASVKVRKEDFRLSRALRRTIVKFLEYINFIVFGLLLAKACLEPFGIGTDLTGGAIGAACALLIEFDSIYGHICDLHGISNRISIKRVFVAWLKRKDEDLGSAVDEAISNDKDHE